MNIIEQGESKKCISMVIDTTEYHSKPVNYDAQSLKRSIMSTKPTECTLYGLCLSIHRGKTIQGAELDMTKPDAITTDENGKEHWHGDSAFVRMFSANIDLDNTYEVKQNGEKLKYKVMNPLETPEDIIAVTAPYGIYPAIIYESFSSGMLDANGEPVKRYRAIFYLDTPIEDIGKAREITTVLMNLFNADAISKSRKEQTKYSPADTACKDPHRFYYGTSPDKQVICYGDNAIITADTLETAVKEIQEDLLKREPSSPTETQQLQLDSNTTTEKPLNTTPFVPTVPTHTGGIDKAISPDYKPEDLLSMIDVNNLEYGEWFSVTSAYKGMGGNREVWIQWNAGWNGKKGQGTNRSADASSWNGADGTPTKGTLIYFAQLHSPQRYEDYKQAMNPYSKKYRTSSGHDGNQSNKEQAQQQHKKYVSPYDVDGTGRLTLANLQAYMQKKGFSVAYDEIQRDNVYFAQNPEAKLHLPETMPTLIENDLQSELRGANAEKISRYLDTLASKNYINPIRTMIEATQWDGIDRLEQFYGLFEIPETDALSRILIRKWCMQCITGLYNTYESPFSLDIVLVFQGKQGISKTRFFEHLAMIPDYFKEACVLDPANKDSVMECTSVWIAELGEIGSTMRKDVDRLKGFLSQARDHYRQPYGRKALKYPRRTSFVGTVNDEKFLLDETGNRRFATVPLTITHTIDYETQIKPFDALQFWAQILQIVRNAIAQGATMGGCFRLTEEEKAQLEGRNVTRLKPLKFEQEFLDTIQMYECKNQNRVEWRFCTATNWLTHNTPTMSGCSAVQLGKILDKYGYKQERKMVNSKQVRGYILPFDKA